MHFALPPRKTSRPPPYSTTRTPRWPYFRRARLGTWLWALGAVGCLVFLLSRLRGGTTTMSRTQKIMPGTPSIVIVTVMDRSEDITYQQLITENRQDYAHRHGYAVFLANLTDYPLSDPPVPRSWARIPATRHAMTTFPHSTWFFQLDQDSLIMDPTLPLTAHILNPARLETLYLPDRPVVPPDSVIRTYTRRSFSSIDLVMTQDHAGLSEGAFILRAGDWAQFFLDAWFDPLYRSYNFERADGHALEHLVQWHGSVLSRLALVPQRIFNSYTAGQEEEMYREGDFVARLRSCGPERPLTCEQEAKEFLRTREALLAEKTIHAAKRR